MTITNEGKICYYSPQGHRYITVWPINIPWMEKSAFSEAEWNLIIRMVRGRRR